MNAIRLFKNESLSDAPLFTATDTYLCGKCGRHGTKDLAESCCKCHYCGEYVEQERNCIRTFHDKCSEDYRSKKHLEAIEKAEDVSDKYTGWLFCEELQRHNEGYFRDLDELLDCVHDLEEDETRPEWAFACDEHFPHWPDSSDVIEQLTQDMYEDAANDFDGCKQLDKALKAFARKNTHLKTYYPDMKRKVRIPKESPCQPSQSA